MKKSAFFDLLESDICAAADAQLAASGRNTEGCPFIAKWIGFYRLQSSMHVERSLLKYAPEAADATTARDYVRAVRNRVLRAVAIWAKTGRVTGIPPGVGTTPPKGEHAEGKAASANSKEGGDNKKNEGFGTGLLRAISGAGRTQFKEREGTTAQPTDAESVRDQLGQGRMLDSSTRGRMESAFGSDFSSVRVHDDGGAWGLSSQLNARAFTVGNNVAFGAGEYKPGTLVGDALIAHELAHVVQQGAATQSNGPMLKGDSDYDALEADADLSAVGAVASLWAGAKGKLTDIGKNAAPSVKSGLRLQRCGGGADKVEPDKVVLKNLSVKERELFAKSFTDQHFPKKDRATARKILDDMLQSNELSFRDEEALRIEIFKRMDTAKLMQETQDLYGKAFEYPEHANACNKDGKKDFPRVNKAAEPYWGPPTLDFDGHYYFDLSEAGKGNAYKALTTLFTPQKSICNMTLIHCDRLASMVHFRAFADSIGEAEFNKRVKNGDIEIRLAYDGFRNLEDTGSSHSKKSISLREVRPANENDLVIGDHVIFWNHRAYDALNEKTEHAWRLENAILVYRKGKEDHFLGHGSKDRTNKEMRKVLADRYNDLVKMAREIIHRAESKNTATASKAMAEMKVEFPNVQKESGDWVIKTPPGLVRLPIGTFPLRPTNPDDPDLAGLRTQTDSSKMNCVKRPAEAPGEPC